MTDADREQRNRHTALIRSLFARIGSLSVDAVRRIDRCVMREERADAERDIGMTELEAIAHDVVLSLLAKECAEQDERIAAVEADEHPGYGEGAP